jgi:hypothetical protein
MRTLFVALALALGVAADARAQWVYSGSAPYGYQYYYPAPPAGAVYPRVYAFKDEPVMSVNRSYLGYTNLVDVSGRPSAPRFMTDYGNRTQGYYVPAPAPRGVRWFGWRRGYRY